MKMRKIFSKIFILPLALAVLLIGCSFYFVVEQRSAIRSIKQAKKYANNQKYDKALTTLTQNRNRWIVSELGLLRDEIKKEFENIEERYRDQIEYQTGLQYFNQEKWSLAEKSFSSVSEKSTYYTKAQEKIESIQDEKLIAEAIRRVKQELEDVRQIAKTAAQKQDISGTIKNWTPLMTPVRCNWEFLEGDLTPSLQGSGLLVSVKDGRIEILTNRHVITYNNNLPKYCEAKIPGVEEILDLSQFKDAYYLSEKENDWGTIDIQKIPEKAYEVAQTIFNRFKPLEHVCQNTLEEGSQIAILGYPKIGLKNNVTVTTGIISGHEDKYYYTDAKISEGNSGGIAVSIENNCLVGIPTAVVKGDAESLGKILDMRIITDD